MLIQSYQQSWPTYFLMLKKEIEEALNGLNVTIEHIGSTAVPDLAAKPIIDIDVLMSPTLALNEVKGCLEKIGYYHNGNQGIPGREAFKRVTGNTHSILDTISHHLYVCPFDSEEFKRHLIFRNYLRTHIGARDEYQFLKYELANAAHQNRKLYASLKEVKARNFVNRIIKQAAE